MCTRLRFILFLFLALLYFSLATGGEDSKTITKKDGDTTFLITNPLVSIEQYNLEPWVKEIQIIKDELKESIFEEPQNAVILLKKFEKQKESIFRRLYEQRQAELENVSCVVSTPVALGSPGGTIRVNSSDRPSLTAGRQVEIDIDPNIWKPIGEGFISDVKDSGCKEKMIAPIIQTETGCTIKASAKGGVYSGSSSGSSSGDPPMAHYTSFSLSFKLNQGYEYSDDYITQKSIEDLIAFRLRIKHLLTSGNDKNKDKLSKQL